MHAREILELAALASSHGGALIAIPGRLPTAGLEQYWTASKARLEGWMRALKAADVAASQSAGKRTIAATYPVLEEILTTELLTRVWSAVLVAHDRRHEHEEAEIVARNIYLGHLEARQRALRLIVGASQTASPEATALNRLRSRVERWSDLLIGHLLDGEDVSEYAVHPKRAKDFARQLRGMPTRAATNQAWSATLATLRAAFRSNVGGCLPSTDANARIAASVLACFPHEAFDSTGVFSSVWVTRMTTTATDAQCLISELFAEEVKPATRPGFGLRQSARSAPPRPLDG